MERLIMGYEYWPQALEVTVRRAWEMTGGQTPVWVTENGIGTDDDDQPIRCVTTALKGSWPVWPMASTLPAAPTGACWTTSSGPSAPGRFGLVEVDRSTFARTPKPSTEWFGSVARANALG
ncbi:MAG: hypothetical protein IPG97_00365 [Microthrixaceae bacterium]|nr:hypothetical protein [Microthrixaceae bacterium]